MKDKDLNVIREHWERVDTVSLKDFNLQLLERNTIMKFIKRTKRGTLKDVGCGDGSDTVHFARHFDKVYAYDYSNAMLTKASKTLLSSLNVELEYLNVLQDNIVPVTDVVITKRMLINLGNFENQKNVIKKIYDSLTDDGYYIMLETCIDGLKSLNRIRSMFNLENIPEPFHNTPFELDALNDFLSEYFIVESIQYFSSYFFLTRVYNALLDKKIFNRYDKSAKDIAEKGIELFSSEVIIGPQFCMLLKK